ncbi:MAG: FHA domain-containing protein [Bacteroidaceae bacterium]|nr:FHA domain-containing protein [Bacteroidaceae bacterium]
MKVYSIGREAGCDIVINDRTDVISRRHAILNVMSSGKMTIVDQSSNGTYVNGIRISPNVPVPVTRKDNISFAHVARLDWNLIPRPSLTYILWGAAAVVALALIVGGAWWGYRQINEPDVVAADTTIISRQDAERMMRQRSDSIRKHIEDSLRIDSLRRDSIKKAQKKIQDAKKVKEKKERDKSKTNTPAKPAKPSTPKRVGR